MNPPRATPRIVLTSCSPVASPERRPLYAGFGALQRGEPPFVYYTIGDEPRIGAARYLVYKRRAACRTGLEEDDIWTFRTCREAAPIRSAQRPPPDDQLVLPEQSSEALAVELYVGERTRYANLLGLVGSGDDGHEDLERIERRSTWAADGKERSHHVMQSKRD